MYSIDLNNVVPHKDLTCLVAKASADECMLWHMRLGHLNYKTMNKLVRHNLVRGLPSKCFENDHTCVAWLKGKKHKASYKTKLVNSVTKPFHTLHMDLFGPTSVSSLNHKWYCLVVIDDFSRFIWTFFLKTKGETSGILSNFITKIENLKELKVKIIRCDNEGEFRNKEMNDFCLRKGIKREFGNARTPQQNRVAKRINRTLIEAARTMVLVNKFQNKTSYELFNGRTPAIGFLKPFGCYVMVLNTLDHLEKFEAQGDEAHLESSKSNAQDTCKADAFERNGNFNHTYTSTNPPTDQMETLTMETLIPIVSSHVLTACLDDSPQLSSDTRLISKRVTYQDDTASLENILTLTNSFEDILGLTTNSDDSNRVEADLGNMEYNISASPTPTFRIHKDHPKSQIIGPVDTSVQTRTKSKEMEEQSFIATIHQKTEPALLQFCLFSYFLSQEEPKKISYALKDLSWVESMQEELLQFKIQNVGLWLIVLKGGTIDQTLFIIRHIRDFILVQVYVDDIIFGYSNPQLRREFEAFMHEKFHMSAMGELNFFLGLQVLQKKDGIILSQDKYVGDILKNFGYSDVKSANTPIDKENPWGKDRTGKDVDLHLYRSMIGSLMYLTTSRPDIMFAVYACARHQVTPKECQLHAVKRIFRYLKGHPKLGLWYPKESPFDLVAYSDSDYGGATQDRKSTSGGC
nr:uncharacterized mitochondrial protein AtMg00810-like [Tanacetum cinerariifolium]